MTDDMPLCSAGACKHGMQKEFTTATAPVGREDGKRLYSISAQQDICDNSH